MALLNCGLILVFAGFLLVFVLDPALDLVVTAQFYSHSGGFVAGQNPLAVILHTIATKGSWIVFVGLALIAVLQPWIRLTRFRPDRKAVAFLALSLLLAPGFIANMALKDQWGRARPSQVTEFGGTAQFTPFYQITDQCAKNCSFVSGDASFGFWMIALAFVIPWRRKEFFLAGLCAGLIFGGNRVMMGAHFLSDVLVAALVMMVAVSLMHALFYGYATTQKRWQEFLGRV